MRFALTILALCFITACSSNDSSTKPFTSAYKNMTGSMALASLINKPTTRSMYSTRAGLATEWTTAYMPDPRCSGGASDPHCSSGAATLKDYMGLQIDDSSIRDNGSSISIFGRIKNGLMIACAMMTVVSDGSGAYPSDGVHNITLDAATKAQIGENCEVAAGDLDNAPATVSITVSTVTGGVYDRKFAMVLNDREGTQDFFLSYADGSHLRLGSLENNSNGASRTLINYDIPTKSGRAEYTSTKPSCTTGCNGESTRLFWDETNQKAAIASIMGGDQNRNYFYVAGKPKDDTATVGLSIFQSGYTPSASGNACVNPSTGDIATDNPTVSATACSVGLVDVTTGAAKTAMDNFLNMAVTNNYTAAYWSTAMTTTTTVGFTSITDIATTDFNL